MTKLEAIAFFMDMDECTHGGSEPIQMAIEALKQEPRKDEVILTKKEYGELVLNEFSNGYAEGYREALKQDSILNKIKADIAMYEADCRLSDDEEPCKQCTDNVFGSIYRIIDKYMAGNGNLSEIPTGSESEDV